MVYRRESVSAPRVGGWSDAYKHLSQTGGWDTPTLARKSLIPAPHISSLTKYYKYYIALTRLSPSAILLGKNWFCVTSLEKYWSLESQCGKFLQTQGDSFSSQNEWGYTVC
jgi:hypothetical protein